MSSLAITLSLLLVFAVTNSAKEHFLLDRTALSLRPSCSPEKLAKFQTTIQPCVLSKIRDKSDTCHVIGVMVECIDDELEECFRGNGQLREYLSTMAVLGLLKGLGSGASSLFGRCQAADRAKSYLMNDVYGGGNNCDFQTSLDRHVAFLQCQQPLEQQYLPSILTAGNVEDGLRQLCQYASSVESCPSRPGYLDCMAPKLRENIENANDVTVVYTKQGPSNGSVVLEHSGCDNFGPRGSYDPTLDELLARPFASFGLYGEHGRFFVTSPEVRVTRTTRTSGGGRSIGSVVGVAILVVAILCLK